MPCDVVPAGLDGDGRRAWLVEHAVYGPAPEAMDAFECAGRLARAGDDVLLEHLVAQATRCDAGFCTALEASYATLLTERTEAFVTVLAKRNVSWKPVAPAGELTRVASFLGHACRRREVRGLPRRDPELAKRLAALAEPEWSDEARVIGELDRMCEAWTPRESWILEAGLSFRTLVRREHAIGVEEALRDADMRALVPALEAHLTDDTPAMERVAAAYVLAARGHAYQAMRDRLIAERQRSNAGGAELVALECLSALARRGDTSLVPVLVREGAACDAGSCTSSMGILESLMRQHTSELVAAVATLEPPDLNQVLSLVGEACWLWEPDRRYRLGPETRAALEHIRDGDDPKHARTAEALERACGTWSPPRR